jgi:cytochrome P450
VTEPPDFPFPDHSGIGPAQEYAALPPAGPLLPVRLRNGTTALLVRRHQDVCKVLTDPAFGRFAAAGFGLTARSIESLALNAVDPPDHTRRRRLVTTAFTHRQVAALRPEVERLAERLTAAMLHRGGQADLVADFAEPLTAAVISRVLGVPESEVGRLRPLIERMMSTTAFSKAEVKSAHQEMFAAFRARIEGWHADPASMLGMLARAARDGDLTADEAVHLAYGLLIAAHETTVNQLVLGVLLLLDDPARPQRLRDRPGLLSAAVTEMLRMTSLNATGGVPHMVTEPVDLGAVTLDPGTLVVPVTDAANHDPEVFQDPGAFRLDRPDNPHLSFGYGRHRCPGAPLAQMEMEVALSCILRMMPGLRLAVPREELAWRIGMYVRGVWKLPVEW